MSPGALHPVESRARELVLMLFGVTDPDARHNTPGVYPRSVYLDLMGRGVPRDAASEHCAAIEAAGRTVPERRLHPSIDEFLEDRRSQIAALIEDSVAV